MATAEKTNQEEEIEKHATATGEAATGATGASGATGATGAPRPPRCGAGGRELPRLLERLADLGSGERGEASELAAKSLAGRHWESFFSAPGTA